MSQPGRIGEGRAHRQAIRGCADGARDIPQEQVEAPGRIPEPEPAALAAPSTVTFRNLLAALSPDDAVKRWMRRHGDEGGHGREAAARASKQAEDGRCMTVAAVEHGSGPVIRQVEVGSRSNGLPAVRDYARRVGIAGCAVALDVTHTQQETSRNLLECGADRVLAAVKENRKGVLAGLKAIGFDGAPPT